MQRKCEEDNLLYTGIFPTKPIVQANNYVQDSSRLYILPAYELLLSQEETITCKINVSHNIHAQAQ